MQKQTERHFPLLTIETASEAAQNPMQWYLNNFEMLPNLAKVMSNSPALLMSYWQTQLNLLQHSVFSKQEINIIETIVAHQNQCQYCVAGHTAFGKNPLFNNTDEQMNAIRNDLDFADIKLNALRDFTLSVLKKQGWIDDSHLENFLIAGYTRTHALDVVACIAAKVMSNYANQIALTPVDEAFVSLTEGLPYQNERKEIPISKMNNK